MKEKQKRYFNVLDAIWIKMIVLTIILVTIAFSSSTFKSNMYLVFALTALMEIYFLIYLNSYWRDNGNKINL